MNALRSIGLIAGREIRSLFLQPLAWVVMTVMLAFMGYSFSALLSFPGISSAPAVEVQRFLFTALLFWIPLLVFIPVVAMRLIAEERASGTLEALLTAPVTENQVAVGKYLGALFFYAVLVSPFALFVGIIGYLGEADWRAASSAFLGLLLVGGYLLAVALCASSLTRNQIVAAIAGFVAVLFLYMAPLLAGLLARDPLWTEIAGYLNLIEAMEEFARGLVDSRRVVYPLAGILFFVFASARLIEAAKGR